MPTTPALTRVAGLMFLALCFCSFSKVADAGLVNTFGTPATIHGDPSNSGGFSIGTIALTGTGGSGGSGDNIGLAGILFFELPDLTAAPNIGLAELTVFLTDGRDDGAGQVPDNYDVNLYLLPAQATLTVNKTGHYGDGGELPFGATLLQAAWWEKGNDAQIGTSKAIDVTSAIQALYAAGTPTNTYAVFALYATTNLPDFYQGTYFFEQDTVNPDGPKLAITSSVPEPNAIVLLTSLSMLVVIHRRKIKKA